MVLGEERKAGKWRFQFGQDRKTLCRHDRFQCHRNQCRNALNANAMNANAIQTDAINASAMNALAMNASAINANEINANTFPTMHWLQSTPYKNTLFLCAFFLDIKLLCLIKISWLAS